NPTPTGPTNAGSRSGPSKASRHRRSRWQKPPSDHTGSRPSGRLPTFSPAPTAVRRRAPRAVPLRLAPMFRRVLLAALAGMLLAACRVDGTVTVDVADDGSGTVEVRLVF